MASLTLTEQEKAGAKKVSDWLKQTADEEGSDRPIFATITEYIVSDIEEALS